MVDLTHAMNPTARVVHIRINLLYFSRNDIRHARTDTKLQKSNVLVPSIPTLSLKKYGPLWLGELQVAYLVKFTSLLFPTPNGGTRKRTCGSSVSCSINSCGVGIEGPNRVPGSITSGSAIHLPCRRNSYTNYKEVPCARPKRGAWFVFTVVYPFLDNRF